MAVGWLWVSTFIRMCTGSCTAPYWRVSGLGKKRPAVWPTMTEEFAGYNAMPRYVVSTTLAEEDSRWPATILRSTDDVAALKETEGGPISVHGSAALGASLADAGLVDRYHLLVFPVLLGAGKRLFSDADKDATRLRLTEHAVYANGVQKQVFDVVR